MRLNPFPPGDTAWRPRRCRWREMCFVYRELCAAIVPHVGLSYVLTHWADITRGLAEPPRKRGGREATAILC